MRHGALRGIRALGPDAVSARHVDALAALVATYPRHNNSGHNNSGESIGDAVMAILIALGPERLMPAAEVISV